MTCACRHPAVQSQAPGMCPLHQPARQQTKGRPKNNRHTQANSLCHSIVCSVPSLNLPTVLCRLLDFLTIMWTGGASSFQSSSSTSSSPADDPRLPYRQMVGTEHRARLCRAVLSCILQSSGAAWSYPGSGTCRVRRTGVGPCNSLCSRPAAAYIHANGTLIEGCNIR